MDLKELAQTARKMAKDELMRDGEVMPAFFAIDTEGKMTIYATPWSSEAEKYITFAMLKAKFKVDKIEAFCFVSEAWTVNRTEEQWKNDHRKPRECEDRVEVIMVAGMSHHGNVMYGDKIIRDADDKVIGTEPYREGENESYDMVKGFVPDLLPPKTDSVVH